MHSGIRGGHTARTSGPHGELPEDKVVIYVANAPLTELQKFFTLVNTITGPVISGVVVSRSVNP